MDLHTGTLEWTSLEARRCVGAHTEEKTSPFGGLVASPQFIGRRPRCYALLPGLLGGRDLSIVTVHPAFKKNPPDSYNFKDVKRVED